jgi:hypothetical protein
MPLASEYGGEHEGESSESEAAYGDWPEGTEAAQIEEGEAGSGDETAVGLTPPPRRATRRPLCWPRRPRRTTYRTPCWSLRPPAAEGDVPGAVLAPSAAEGDVPGAALAPPAAEGDVQAAFDSLFADIPPAEEGTDFDALLDELEEELRSEEPGEREGKEERRIPCAESVRVATNCPALLMVPLPASLHPRRGRGPESDDEPHPEAASSGAPPRGPDLIEEPGEEPQPPSSGASGSAQPDYVVLDSFVDGGDTTQVVHGPVRFDSKAPLAGVDVMQDLVGKDSNGRAFWVIGCVTEGAVLDRLAGANDETARAVLDWGGAG